MKITATFKIWFLSFCLLTGACTGNQIPLLNYSLNTWWGGLTPSSIAVKKGDTLYSISRKYDVPLRDVIEENHLRPPYALRIGQILKLPSAKRHTVSKGDTLYSISKKYNVDLNSLSRINHIHPPYALRIGQILLLPGTVVDADNSSAVKKAPTSFVISSAKSKTNVSKWQKKPTVTHKRSNKSTKYHPQKYRPRVSKRYSKFAWPVQGRVISKFGPTAKGRHNDGINIKAPLGTAVKSADSGTVAYAGNELRGYGNLILVKHSGGWITAYAHNDRLLVRKGQKVRKGEKIATVGSTGSVSSPQLHFEVRAGKKSVNPLAYLK